MEKDIIVNSSLIIAFLFIAGQLFKENKISPSSSLKLRLLAGVIYGLLGSCLMIFSIEVSDSIIVDMRNIALVFSAICGGWVAALLSAVIMSITRIGIFGFNEASVFAVIVLISLAVCSMFVLKLKCSDKMKYWLLILTSILFFSIAFDIILMDKMMLLYVLLSYILILSVIAYFSYFVYEYIKNSNELFRRYKVESKVDYLTGLYNYRQFDELFDSQIKIVQDGNEKLSVLAIDIDHFKMINDTYGHPVGDEVLQRLGVILKNTVRKFDIVARCGGEEFSIMLLDCPQIRALEIAERIRRAVEQETFNIIPEKMINITISVGVSSFPETTNDAQLLLKQADHALYEAKHNGRNLVRIFNSRTGKLLFT